MTGQIIRAEEKTGRVRYSNDDGAGICEGNSIVKVKEEIRALRGTLDYLVGNGIGFDTLQELSLRINKLIVEYYKIKQKIG